MVLAKGMPLVRKHLKRDQIMPRKQTILSISRRLTFRGTRKDSMDTDDKGVEEDKAESWGLLRSVLHCCFDLDLDFPSSFSSCFLAKLVWIDASDLGLEDSDGSGDPFARIQSKTVTSR